MPTSDLSSPSRVPLRASDAGMRDRRERRQHGVAVKTIRRWRRSTSVRGLARGQAHTRAAVPALRRRRPRQLRPTPSCWAGISATGTSRGQRGRLATSTSFNDERYAGLNATRHGPDASRCKPGGRPHTRMRPRLRDHHGVRGSTGPACSPSTAPVASTSARSGWRTGSGRSSTTHPGDFLRGLFHSDGCRTNNWATRMVAGQKKRYDYPRWEFVNDSDDIIDLLHGGARSGRHRAGAGREPTRSSVARATTYAGSTS